MPERLNICCLFTSVPTDRWLVFETLFNAAPSWMGRPSSYMMLELDSQRTTEGALPLPDSIATKPLGRRLLFAYSSWIARPHRYRACVGLSETERQAVYCLSVPISALRPIDIHAVERQCLAIYEAVSLLSEVVALIGPELDIDETQSVKETVSSAGDGGSLALWIIAPRQYLLPADTPWPFEVVHADARVALLRHGDAEGQIT
jgi:hypothetical protein